MLRIAATSALTCTVLASPQTKLWELDGVDEVDGTAEIVVFDQDEDTANNSGGGTVTYAEFCERYGAGSLFGGQDCPSETSYGANCRLLNSREACTATEYCREKASIIPNIDSDFPYVCDAYPSVNQFSDDYWCKVLSYKYDSNQGCKQDNKGMTFKGEKRLWSKPNGPSGTYCGIIDDKVDCYMMAPCSWDADRDICYQDKKDKKRLDRSVKIRDLASIDDGFEKKHFKAALNLAIVGNGNGATAAANVAALFPGLFKGVGLVNGVMNKELADWRYLGWMAKHNMAYSPQHLKDVPLFIYNGEDEMENVDKMLEFWEDIGGVVDRVGSKAQSPLWPSFNFCKEHIIDNVDDKIKAVGCDYVANSKPIKFDLPAYMLPFFFKDVEGMYGADQIELSEEEVDTALENNLAELETFDQKPFCTEKGLAASCSELHLAEQGIRYVPKDCKNKQCNAIMLLADCEQANPSNVLPKDSGRTVGEVWLATSGFMEHAAKKDIILVMPMTAKSNSEKNGCWNVDGYAKTPGNTIDLDTYNTGFNRQYQVLMSIATAIQHNEQPKQEESVAQEEAKQEEQVEEPKKGKKRSKFRQQQRQQVKKSLNNECKSPYCKGQN